MPIYKGTTNIGAIYKGTTPIGRIYKGTTLIFESGTWEQWYQEFIYNALIPTTINSKQVKNKAKVDTIYGNSVVENQLVRNGNFEDASNWSSAGTISIANNIATFTATAQNQNLYQNLSIASNSNHKYLFTSNIKLSSLTNGIKVLVGYESPTEISVPSSTSVQKLSRVFSPNSSNTQFRLYIRDTRASDWDSIDVSNVMLIDLTQMFPINTPTTLNDTRIQALLNRGYIPYNSGEIKSVDVSEISSEPYNLLSLDRTAGTLTDYGEATLRDFDETKYYVGLNIANNYTPQSVSLISYSDNSFTINCSDGYGIGLPVKVIGGQTYAIDYTNSGIGTNSIFMSWYDANGKWISYNGITSSTATAPQNAYYGVIVFRPNGEQTYSNICLRVDGTRTGYAPYKALTPLSFKYQGNGVGTAHDALEITSSAYVFTKNIASADLGSLSWFKLTDQANNSFTSATSVANCKPASTNNVRANVICPKYTTSTKGSVQYNINDKTIAISTSSNVFIQDSTYTNATTTDFKTAMSGVYLYYELATPQVITIPKKHLGIVDLGTLSWSYASGNKFFYARTSNLNMFGANVDQIANLFCSMYISASKNHVETLAYTENEISATNSSTTNPNRLSVRNTKYTDPTIFKNAMNGVLLFYETQDEVADIPISIDIQAGGTITTNSNVLPNIEFNVKCK